MHPQTPDGRGGEGGVGVWGELGSGWDCGLTLCRLFPINTKYTEQKPNCVTVRKTFTTYLEEVNGAHDNHQT